MHEEHPNIVLARADVPHAKKLVELADITAVPTGVMFRMKKTHNAVLKCGVPMEGAAGVCSQSN